MLLVALFTYDIADQEGAVDHYQYDYRKHEGTLNHLLVPNIRLKQELLQEDAGNDTNELTGDFDPQTQPVLKQMSMAQVVDIDE